MQKLKIKYQKGGKRVIEFCLFPHFYFLNFAFYLFYCKSKFINYQVSVGSLQTFGREEVDFPELDALDTNEFFTHPVNFADLAF